MLPVGVPAPARLPRLVELQPVGEGEALALPPAVVPPPPRVPVRAHHHLNNIYVKIFYSCKNIYLAAWSGAGDGGAEPLVRAHLVPAGRLGGAGHDVVDGGAVASSLGQGTLPHTARPATHTGQGDTETSIGLSYCYSR